MSYEMAIMGSEVRFLPRGSDETFDKRTRNERTVSQ